MITENFYETQIQNCRDLIEVNLPIALEAASIPKEDHQSIINRVLGRVPVSVSDNTSQGLNAALVVGLGLLDSTSRRTGLAVSIIPQEVRDSFTQVAFNEYTWDDEDYLDADFVDLPDSLDLYMIANDVGGLGCVDIVGLLNQIDIFRQTIKSPLVTKIRALSAYKNIEQGKNPAHKAKRHINCIA